MPKSNQARIVELERQVELHHRVIELLLVELKSVPTLREGRRRRFLKILAGEDVPGED